MGEIALLSAMDWILLASLLPVVLLLIYIYAKDRYQKEPLRVLLKALLGGILSALAVLASHELLQLPEPEIFTESLQQALYQAFCFAAVPEESFKLLFLYWFIWKNSHFDEYFDGIEYAVFVGLGFAGFENVLYVMQGGVEVAVARALTAVPAHFFFAVFMGYFFALAKFRPRKRSRYMFLAWLVPVLFHGIYDFILMYANLLTEDDPSMAAVLSLLFYIFFIVLWRKAKKRINRLTNR